MGDAIGHLRFQPTFPARIAELDQLLISGGDERTQLHLDTGRNRYGCTASPDPELVSLGSCTASTISAQGYAAAAQAYQRIRIALREDEPTQVFARERFRICQELLDLCQLTDMAGLEVILAASGTDAYRFAVQKLRRSLRAPLHILTLNPEETGSHIPTVFQEVAAKVDCVPLRYPDGTPRARSEVDADFARLADQAIGREENVLLVLTDVSKTGLLAPSPALATELRLNYPHHCEVLVDASQFRLSNDTLRGYLEQDFIVAMTGSKFISGPSFSGALLLPACVSQWLGYRDAASELNATPVNFGMLLRWQAALTEFASFRSLSSAQISSYLRTFGSAVRQRLETDPAFRYLAVNELARGSADGAWDNLQTIFSFIPLLPNGRPADRPATARLHQRLQIAENPSAGIYQRFQLGQPVLCGQQQNTPVSALRLCASARMIVTNQAESAIHQAHKALDKAKEILRDLGRGV